MRNNQVFKNKILPGRVPDSTRAKNWHNANDIKTDFIFGAKAHLIKPVSPNGSYIVSVLPQFSPLNPVLEEYFTCLRKNGSSWRILSKSSLPNWMMDGRGSIFVPPPAQVA